MGERPGLSLFIPNLTALVGSTCKNVSCMHMQCYTVYVHFCIFETVTAADSVVIKLVNKNILYEKFGGIYRISRQWWCNMDNIIILSILHRLYPILTS